jgi:hypothetical protein
VTKGKETSGPGLSTGAFSLSENGHGGDTALSRRLSQGMCFVVALIADTGALEKYHPATSNDLLEVVAF